MSDTANIVNALRAVPAPSIPTIPAAGTLPLIPAMVPTPKQSQVVTAPAIPAAGTLPLIPAMVPAPNQNQVVTTPTIPALGSLPTIAPIINPGQPIQLSLAISSQQQSAPNTVIIPPLRDILDVNTSSTVDNLGNVGKRWTKEEENEVVRALMQNVAVGTIANNVGRTKHGVKLRILQILNNKFTTEGVYDGRNTSEGWNANEACLRYQVTYNELLEFKSRAQQRDQNHRGNFNTTNIGQSTVAHDPILVEIRDLLLAMNRKLDMLSNTTQ